MKARAPGKVVLSGAYSVLDGAPAIVSAVDRYALADSERTPDWVAPEVRAAFGEEAPPAVDASALREGDRKLGLGSSAAIVVAALATRAQSAGLTPALLNELESRARQAHRAAQGGGSGIDVAVSVWGGTLLCRLEGNDLRHEAVSLPSDLVVEVWASPSAASTKELLASVRRAQASHPREHRDVMAALREAAERAVDAVATGSASLLIEALAAQCDGLDALGSLAGEPIVTAELRSLAELARREGAAFLPSGAGAGDVSLWVSTRASSPELRRLAGALRHHQVPLCLHARGVHHVE